jgi:hypothetical protein
VCLSKRTMTWPMPIEGDFVWAMAALRGKRPAEEGLSSCDAAGLAQIEVNRSALLVYTPVEVVPVALDVDEGLVNPPRRTDGAREAVPALFDFGDVALNPTADRAGNPLDATLEHHLREVAVGQLIGDLPAYAQQNDLVGEVTLPEHGMMLATSHRGSPETGLSHPTLAHLQRNQKEDQMTTNLNDRPPLPPYTRETAVQTLNNLPATA